MGKLTIDQWLGVKRISAKKLAKMTGISESTLSHWKTGKATPTIGNLKKVAAALEITVDDIYF